MLPPAAADAFFHRTGGDNLIEDRLLALAFAQHPAQALHVLTGRAEPERMIATLASGTFTPSLSTLDVAKARYSPRLKPSRIALRSLVAVWWVMAGMRNAAEMA